LEDFITRSQKLYNNFYSYEKTVLKQNNKQKVTITCPKHGDFEVTPNNHLSNFPGCKKCKHKKAAKHSNIWKTSEWVKMGENSKKFDGFKIYLIECWNETERFYKIGKTYTTVHKRYAHKAGMPYEYRIIHQLEGSGRYISEQEKILQKALKNLSYTPQLSFGGQYECFEFKSEVLELYKNYNNVSTI